MSSVSAQDYLPFLKDGRKWECVMKYAELDPDFDTGGECNFTITVCGDTVVNGETWKRLKYDNETDTSVIPKGVYYKTAYEKDGRLYGWVDGKENALMIDMNLNKGENVKFANANFDYERFNVLDKDTVTVLGVKRHFLKVDIINDSYWIEGIGSTNSLSLCSLVYTHHGMRSYIQKCYDNGKLIFSIDEFKPHGKPVGIKSTIADVHNDGKTYNINGTTANGTEKNKILIRNGKKFINRF